MPLEPAVIEAYDASRDLARKPFRSACYAPFVSMVFDSIGRVRACCVNFEYPLGDIRTERLDQIWSGPRIKALREALVHNDFSKGCGYCHWRLADGQLDGRDLTNSSLMTLKYENLPVEPAEPFWPTHLEFHMSNVCNLECVMCSGEFSAPIRAKRERLPPIPRAFGDQFFDDLWKYLPRLRHAQFLGGEPFLIREHQRVWDMLIELGLRPDVHVNTNGTVWNEKVERVLDRLPVSVNISMDACEKDLFERIRLNANWDEVYGNFLKFRAHCKAHGRHIGISYTLGRLNWRNFIDFLVFANDHETPVSICTLFHPEEMSLYTLPANELEQVVTELDRQGEENEDRLGRNLATFRNHLADLRHRLTQIDERMFFQTDELTPDEAVPPPRLRLIDYFDGMSPHAPNPFTARDARQALESWADREVPVATLEISPDDVIESASPEIAPFLADAAEAAGKRTIELFGVLATNFGSEIRTLSETVYAEFVDRTILFRGSGKPGTLVRTIFFVRRDRDGAPLGTILFATRRPAKSPSLVILT